VIRVDIIQHVPVRAPKRDIGRSECANREDRARERTTLKREESFFSLDKWIHHSLSARTQQFSPLWRARLLRRLGFYAYNVYSNLGAGRAEGI
jgi:hypothetical protein